MTSTLADAFAVLADPLRRRIVELLADEQLCTCHLVEELDVKQPTVSHHLRVLREAGVVDAAPCGRFTYYRLRPDVLDRLADGLTSLADAARATADRRRAC
jgi:ArsR family transcriptional regulator, arsenate/arsenite/antimonite-responsive transcriptional repressor